MKVQNLENSFSKIKQKLFKKSKNNEAMTLIEILIVIAIIAVLLVALFMVYRNSIDKARDAERKKDLKKIKLAMEDYYNDHGEYPPDGSLNDCDGDSLMPYLKQIPCDPTSGEPYLYLTYPGGGDTSQGYRVLTKLDNKADPAVGQLGCDYGCGMPEDHALFTESADYVYGISEGVPIVYDDIYIPSPTPSSSPTAIPTPDEDIDAEYCRTHLCYCCSSQVSEQQDCNIWDPDFGACGIGPYETAGQCYDNTPCVGN